jgi:hypothetical protein
MLMPAERKLDPRIQGSGWLATQSGISKSLISVWPESRAS